MLKENSFAVALGFSFIGHASLFAFTLSQFNPNQVLSPKKGADVEVTYFKMREIPQIKEVPQWFTPRQKEAKALSTLEVSRVVKDTASAEMPREEKGEGKDQNQNLEEETLSREMAAKLQDPVFLTYYQGIRETIRKAARRRYQNRFTRGDISLGFTLFSNGRVKEVRVLKESSKETSHLRTLVVQSLLDAAPFPPFPDPLRHDQISFLVVLTFEPKP